MISMEEKNTSKTVLKILFGIINLELSSSEQIVKSDLLFQCIEFK